MRTSIYSLILIRIVAPSLEVLSTSAKASESIPASSSAFFINFINTLFVFIASLPPRRTTALPVLIQRAAASTVTLGLASKIIATTPSGTLVLFISIPLGLVQTSPIPRTSLSPTSSYKASLIPLILASLRVRRSTIVGITPFFSALFTSITLASRISSLFSMRAFAILIRA